jgi:hypothetical protein
MTWMNEEKKKGNTWHREHPTPSSVKGESMHLILRRGEYVGLSYILQFPLDASSYP